MANINFKLLRSSTAAKRPTAAQLAEGELGLNFNTSEPGLFFEDAAGAIRKVGPAHVGSTAPNTSPQGYTGLSAGESWLDTSVTPNEFRVWDGSAWQSASGAGTPGGNTTEVQFNNAGAFDGNSNFTFNDADEILSVTTFEGDLDGAVVFTAEASVNITKGDVVYIDGIQGNNPTVNLARADSTSTMPAFGIADVDITSGSTGHIVSFGQIGNLDTSTPGFALGETLYVSDTTAGELVNTAPAGEGSLIQNVGRVERISTTVGRVVVAGAGRTNATPNLDDGNIFIGDASNQSSTSGFNAALTAQAGIDGSATTATRLTLNDNNALFDGTIVTGGAFLDNNGTLFFEEATANGSNYMAFQAPAALTTTSVFQLPDGDGTSGQRLATDGAGTLSWVSPGAGALTNGNIFVGDAGGLAADVSMSGDITIDNTGATTISNDAVTTVKILDDAVTNAKIVNDAITADKIFDANVTSAKIQTDVALGGSPTTTTQSAGDSSTKIATTAFVTGAITTSNSLTDGRIFVGDANNVATGVAVSGDVTLSNTGVVDIIDDVNLGGNPTTTTQLDSDNSTRVATTAFVRTRVDQAIQGLSTKNSVIAATTANVTLSGTQTIDGIALVAGDRVLVKNQTDAAENGIYVVDGSGWTRSDDANIWDELVGAFVFVEAGTQNASSGFVDDILAGGTLGTDDIDWIQFSSAGSVSAGNGLVKTGNVLDVVTADATRIVVNSGDIDLATTGVAAGTYTSLTVDAYGRATSGTVPTTFAGYSISDNSAGLASVLSDETGSGFVVFSASPALTGVPTAPTATALDNSTTLATTAYVDGAVGASNSLNDTNIFVGNGSNVATGVAMSGDATIANTGALTIGNDAITTVKILDANVTGAKIETNVALAGSPTTTTQTAGDSSTKIATTAFVTSAVSSATPTLTSGDIFVGNASSEATAVTMSGDLTIASSGATTIKTDVALAGSPTTTTQTAGDNSTKIATTAYVDAISGSSVTVSATAPSSPAQGDLWYNTVDGRMYVYYYDGNTSQWVDASPNGLNPAPGSDTQVIFNDNGTVSATSDLTIGSSSIGVGVDVLPDTDNTYDLGSPDFRFANIYTGDLHLKNDRGDWTMIEEDDALTMRNNKTGKVYNIMMQERA